MVDNMKRLKGKLVSIFTLVLFLGIMLSPATLHAEEKKQISESWNDIAGETQEKQEDIEEKQEETEQDLEIKINEISLSEKKKILGVGEKFLLQVNVSPENFTENFVWSSSNKEVVTVSKRGKLTAVGEGKAYIKVKTASKRSAKCRVVVRKAPDHITLNRTKIQLYSNEVYQLKAKRSENSVGVISWKSSNPEVAMVDSNGRVIAYKAGTAQLIARAYNGVKAKCSLQVLDPVNGIDLDQTSLSLSKNQSKKLTAQFYPKGSFDEVTWSTSNPAVAEVSQNGVVTGSGYGTATITAMTLRNNVVAKCNVTVKAAKQIALTFDDGPGSYTDKLLDFLKENNIKATFFMLGSNVPRYQSTVKRMREEGHELGSHSYSHPQLNSISSTAVLDEINKTKKEIYKASGSNPTVFRPPYGLYNSTVLNATGVPTIFWSVDTLDWKYKNVEYVKKTILKGAKDGEIILLHDIHPTTVEGAMAAMKQLKEEGYEFMTVTEILTRNGDQISAGNRYSKAPALK